MESFHYFIYSFSLSQCYRFYSELPCLMLCILTVLLSSTECINVEARLQHFTERQNQCLHIDHCNYVMI